MADVKKLQTHLKLLREEFLGLQQKYNRLLKKYESINVIENGDPQTKDSFVCSLLNVIANMLHKTKYSDVTFLLADDSTIPGHKFVLQARRSTWGTEDLETAMHIDLTSWPKNVGEALVSWVYTDNINLADKDEDFMLSLLSASSKFCLPSLVKTCEQCLLPTMTVENCIKYYMISDELKAFNLKKHCSSIISDHWSEFTPEDFATMPAPLLLDMLESKMDFPLHAAIKSKRDDVVFLFLSRHFNEDTNTVNSVDAKGDLPLDLALRLKLVNIAENLISYQADVDCRDLENFTLLHKAILREDEPSAGFLIRHGCDVNLVTPDKKRSPLHLTALVVSDSLYAIAEQLIIKGSNVNLQDCDGCQPLHLALTSDNRSVFSLILSHPELQPDIRDAKGRTCLWIALSKDDGFSTALELIRKGASPDAVEETTRNSLLHVCCHQGLEEAGVFLCEHGADVNHRNARGETPLHAAAYHGLGNLVRTMLSKGSDMNMQMTGSISSEATGQSGFQTPSAATLSSYNPFEEVEEPVQTPVTMQTALHLSICAGHTSVVEMLLASDLSVRDSQGNSAFSLALWNNLIDVARRLLTAGASINEVNVDGMSLLQQAILMHNSRAALFLIDNNADISYKSPVGENCLHLAIRAQMPAVVEVLCKRGADLECDCPLGLALQVGNEEIAQILVRQGAALSPWVSGPEGCEQSLLHRVLDENNEAAAVFLIRSGAEVNTLRRLGPTGDGESVVKERQTPLHVCASWGLERATQAMVEHSADVNAQDSDGNTPLHLAIQDGHVTVIALLLSHPSLNLRIKNARGITPFAAAMETRNEKVAQTIVDREPLAPELRDNRGRNFLHKAVEKGDLDSVLFLISIHVDVNSRVEDQTQLTPLHLAVSIPNPGPNNLSVVRHLLLAGADIDARTTGQRRTPLHLACLGSNPDVVAVLLENQCNVSTVDDTGENCLHLAMKEGHLGVCKQLLQHGRVDPNFINMKGQTPLHLLAHLGRDNAASIFEQLLLAYPQLNVDLPDAEGNSALLLAYMQGNVRLCTALVKLGASLGVMNKYNKTVFNHQVPTTNKQLLFTLLDILDHEPAWTEGDFCLECQTRFSLKNRKHHCRHCGRLLCASCSKQQCAIVKYEMKKPERVCDTCFEYLTCRYGFD